MVGALLSLNAFDCGFEPASLLLKTEQGYRLEVQLPGVSKDRVKVQAIGKCLLLSVKELDKSAPVGRVIGQSVHFMAPRASQELVWRLSEELDAESAKASMQDGVLTVEFLTRTQSNAREIKLA